MSSAIQIATTDDHAQSSLSDELVYTLPDVREIDRVAFASDGTPENALIVDLDTMQTVGLVQSLTLDVNPFDIVLRFERIIDECISETGEGETGPNGEPFVVERCTTSNPAVYIGPDFRQWLQDLTGGLVTDLETASEAA